MKVMICVLLFHLRFFSPLAVAGDYRLGLGAGIFDASDKKDTLAGALTLEGKPLPALWHLRTTVQLLAIDDSGYYFGLGVLKEFFFDDDWSCGLGFSAGLAHESKESRALEYDLEFYSRILLAWQINQNNAMRLEFGHISNGGMSDTNPGTEPLLLSWLHTF
jgi:hypothetical protein